MIHERKIDCTFFLDVYDLQVFSHVNSCRPGILVSHRVFLFLPGRKRRLSSTSALSGEKTCEKLGTYFFYFVGEAEQSIKEYVALSLSIPTSKESRLTT